MGIGIDEAQRKWEVLRFNIRAHRAAFDKGGYNWVWSFGKKPMSKAWSRAYKVDAGDKAKVGNDNTKGR